MTKYLVIFGLLLPGLSLMAQPDYPAAPTPASNVLLAEYFFDSDPGAGNGNSVLLPNSTDVGSFSVSASLNGLASGFHRLYLRSKDGNGIWSHTANAFFDNYIVPPYNRAPVAADTITQLEYFFDVDPGFGNGNQLAAGPATNLNNQQFLINVTGLIPGLHQLYVRSKDQAGNWSLTHFGLFDNSLATPYPEAPAVAPPISLIEYYIDTDPGFGNGTSVATTPGADISNLSINIPLSSITPGRHTLYIRSLQNPWSLSGYADFTYASALPVEWLFVNGEIRNAKAMIKWATATETDAVSFTIEHSLDGRNFFAVGAVVAPGTTGSAHQYQFFHDGLQPGLNIYRIKQTDRDGRFSYSKFIHLLYRNGQSSPTVSPNPVTNRLFITGYENQHVQSIDLFDMTGKLAYSKQFNAAQQSYDVDMTGMAAGIYSLRIRLADKTDSYKIIKQ